MICPKCNKCYFKKAYYQKHLERNNCLKSVKKIDKSPIISEEPTEDDIENAIKRVTDSIISNRKTNNILEKGMEEIITKVIKDNSEENNIKSQLDSILVELNLLKERVSLLERVEPKIETNQVKETAVVLFENKKIKSIKKEKINIEKEIAQNYLSYRDVESDAQLLHKYYIDDVNKQDIPIKKNKSNNYIFWNGEEWIQDNGNNLKSILIYNLKKLYTKNNIVDDSNNSSEYLINQEHINSLNTKKYQQKLHSIFLEKYCV